MLEGIYQSIQNFYGCDGLVFGDGKPAADIMLIGEAPGKDEVAQGRPFCGKAGKNLDGFLQAVSLPREGIYISNVCKFRPVKISEKGTVSNRPPKKDEILAALPFLYEEIHTVNPKLIVTLGNTPLRACTRDFSLSIGEYHGKSTKFNIDGRTYPVFALYHPASIIYNRSLAEVYADDLEKLSNTVKIMNRC